MNRFAPSASAWRQARPSRRLLSAAALIALLAGCTHVHTATIDRHVIVGSVPEDYRTTHPIAIEEGIETLDVPAGLNTVSLTTGVKEIIDGFARAFLASGSSDDRHRHAGGLDQPGRRPRPRGRDTGRARLRRRQSERRSSSASTLPRPSEVTAPIRLAYSKIGAHTAGCGPWPDQVTRNIENRNYFNYGCATQQNLAAMVANPLDLLYPRGMTPPDATRRGGVHQELRGQSRLSHRLRLRRPRATIRKSRSASIAQGVGN